MKASELLQTNDAQVWARDFIGCKDRNGWTLDDIDEGLMIGWFANAMASQENCTQSAMESSQQDPLDE